MWNARAILTLVLLASPLVASDERITPLTHECRIQNATCGATINDVVSAFICVRSEDFLYYNVYALNIRDGANPDVELTMRSPILDSYLELVNPANVTVATNDNGGGERDARIGIKLTPGTWIIKAGDRKFNDGPYTLTIGCTQLGVPGPPPGEPPPCPKPIITKDPLSQTVINGTSPVLTVEAISDRGMTFQWYGGPFEGRYVTYIPIHGATSSTFIPPALTKRSGYYADVSNECGTVRSISAFLEIFTPGPRRRSVRR